MCMNLLRLHYKSCKATTLTPRAASSSSVAVASLDLVLCPRIYLLSLGICRESSRAPWPFVNPTTMNFCHNINQVHRLSFHLSFWASERSHTCTYMYVHGIIVWKEGKSGDETVPHLLIWSMWQQINVYLQDNTTSPIKLYVYHIQTPCFKSILTKNSLH